MSLALVFCCALSCGRSRRGEPLFVFAVIGDPHITEKQWAMFRQPDDYRYLKALSVSPDLLTTCVQDVNAYMPKVDFTIVLGDMADDGYERELLLAKAILDNLGAPYYPVIGNHDVWQAKYGTVFGHDRASYAFEYEGVHFVVINSIVPGTKTVGWNQEVRDWTAADLKDHGKAPTFVLTHGNLYQTTWGAMFKGEGVYGPYEGAEEMREVFETAGNVVAVVTGHVHANRLEVHNGVPYIEVGSPCIARASVRYFHVYEDRTEMTYEYLSNEELRAYTEKVADISLKGKKVEETLQLIDGREKDKASTLKHPVRP